MGYPLSNQEVQALITPPAAGTSITYYLDGTAGDDTNSGTGDWANAWKTWDKLAVELTFAGRWKARTFVFVRGDFGGAAVYFETNPPPGCNIYLGVPMSEHPLLQTGPLNVVTAATLAVGIPSFTLGAPIVLSNADLGRLIQFTDGTSTATYRIIRVDAGTNTAWISTESSAMPAWIVGGGGVTCSIFGDPALNIGAFSATIPGRNGYTAVATYEYDNALLFDIVGGKTNVSTAGGLLLGTSAASLALFGSGTLRSIYRSAASTTRYLPDAVLEAFGLLGGPAPAADVGVSVAGSFYGYMINTGNMSGYVRDQLYEYSRGAWRYVNVGSAYSAELYLYKVFVHGWSTYGITVTAPGSSCTLTNVSFVDLPAAGLPNGAIDVRYGGLVSIGGPIDGNNTGTGGSSVHGIFIRHGGKVVVVNAGGVISASFKAKHSKFYVEGGELFLQGASIDASQGLDKADIYVGPGGKVVNTTGAITKTATNPSGGWTAKPVIKVAPGGEFKMNSGNIVLPAGSGNNATDWGADGAIVIEGDVKTGTLTGLGPATTGVACKIRNGGRLFHAGATGLQGISPLQLGGTPGLLPWPAAAMTDNGAPVPEGCLIIPNVA